MGVDYVLLVVFVSEFEMHYVLHCVGYVTVFDDVHSVGVDCVPADKI